MSILEQSRESFPPADLDAERLFLSACLVANWTERDPCMLDIAISDFHDPFHQWIFAGMRHGRRLKSNDLMAFLYERHKTEPAPIHNRSIAREILSLVYKRDGVERCGDVAKIRRYGMDLKFAAILRAKQLQLEKQLVDLMEEAREYRWDNAEFDF